MLWLNAKKVRNYFDVWKLNELQVDRDKTKKLFGSKLRVKNLAWHGLQDIFPPDLADIFAGYWGRELARLVWPVPDMDSVLKQLEASLSWLNLSPTGP